MSLAIASALTAGDIALLTPAGGLERPVTFDPLTQTVPDSVAAQAISAATFGLFASWVQSLPTTPPQQSGVVWNNGGLVCVS